MLTFYTERLAQESFLRTARDRISLQELGPADRLPPAAGRRRRDAARVRARAAAGAAARRHARPGLGAAGDARDRHARGRPARAEHPGPGEQPQTFETVEAIDARPEWNALPVTTTIPYHARFGDTRAWLLGTGLNVKAATSSRSSGPTSSGERWDVRVLTARDARR